VGFHEVTITVIVQPGKLSFSSATAVMRFWNPSCSGSEDRGSDASGLRGERGLKSWLECQIWSVSLMLCEFRALAFASLRHM
jgi:hypothetical protein